MGDSTIFDLLREMKDSAVAGVEDPSLIETESQTKKRKRPGVRSARQAGQGGGAERRRMGDSVLLDEWWTDDEEAEDGIIAVSQVSKMTIGPPTKPALLQEAARWRCMSQIASRFKELASDALGKNWSRHFEKWLYSTRSTYEASGNTLQDPCLPSFAKGSDGRADRVDAELHRKLVAAGMHPHKASGICQDIARMSTKAIQVSGIRL